MYLSEIELVGFKSFASKTKLKFSSGLSAIVGPNGCGKSNIVDAMRWVLGEKKASNLRSENMNNLIFNGSKNRKPTSMAEVTLVIDNNKKILPVEYDQLTVTRRLFRNGDSEFLINKAKCRMKDVHSIFMDTGIGPDSYSVIELAMVESILSGRLDERRKLFEEAAGIKKYKQRRKETRSRLVKVHGDMERLGDIVEEVRKNVNSLQRQAAKTRRYNMMRSELEELELILFAREFAKLTADGDEAEQYLKKTKTEKEDLERRYAEYQETVDGQREELALVEADFETAETEEKRLADIIADRKKIIAVTEEKISGATGAEQRLESEIKVAETRRAETENEIKVSEQRLAELHRKAEEAEEVFLAAKSETESAATENTENREKLQSAKSEVMRLAHALSSGKEELASLKSRRERTVSTLRKLEERKNDYSDKLTKIEEKALSLEKDGEKLEILLEETKTELARAEEQKATLLSVIEKNKEESEQLQSELSARKASLVFLEGIRPGGESVKFLSNRKDWNSGSGTLLEEIFTVDEKYNTALHAALGSAATAFIINEHEDAFKAIELLKSENKGKAGFISLSQSNTGSRHEYPKINIEGIIGYADEIASVEDKFRTVASKLLAGTVFVESEKEAAEAIKAGAAKAVTLDGEVFFETGFIRGGSKNKSEGIAVGRKVKIKKLQSKIDEIEEKIESAKEIIENAKEETKLLDIPALDAKVNSVNRDIQKNQGDISRLRLDREAVERNAEMNDDNVKSYTGDLEAVDSEISKAQEKLVSLQPELDAAENRLKEVNSETSAAEKHHAFCMEQQKTAEIDKMKIKSDISTSKEAIERAKATVARLRQEKTSKRNEIENASRNRKALRETLAIKLSELEDAEKKIIDAQSKKNIAKEEKTLIAEQIEHNRMSAGALQKDAARKNESMHRIELNLNEVNIRKHQIKGRALEDYDIDIEKYQADIPENFSDTEAKKQTALLKEKLSKLGNINFQALEEYDLQKERLEFSEMQMADLIESEKILNETIDELNTKAEEAFRDTYDKIRQSFKKLFKKLFGEDGDADLRLVDTDVLESDIEITARPPGKRPHSIEMLSGGEKTLTAIALLFAIYLVKPSPFCILDEVDAPLDDKNLDKYLEMILEFSKETQFMLVTHNKQTMSKAESLYGITMQEQGVSKVVSVNVEQE